MIETKDIYWLAGVLEGEGTFALMRHGQPRIQLRMTDRDVVERVALILGGLAVHESRAAQPRRQPIYGCAVAGRKAAGWMMTIYLCMGQRRREGIRQSLSAWRATRRYVRRTDKKLPAHLTVPEQPTTQAS